MAEFKIALGGVIEAATSSEVDASNDRLFDRLTGSRRRGIYRKPGDSVLVPAATYSNGLQAVINFGSPAHDKLWLIRSLSWVGVDTSTAIPTFTTGPAGTVPHLMVGTCPQQVTASTVSATPSPSELVDYVAANDANYEQPHVVHPNEQAYLYLLAPASVTYAQQIVYIAVISVLELDGSQALVGGV